MGDHIYDELADLYARSSATGPPNALYDRPTIVRLLGPVEGRRVLELGCAAGHLAEQLIGAGADVTALDKSERMAEHARRRVGNRARVVVADLTQPLGFVDDATMDLVAASLVLHYLLSGTTSSAKSAEFSSLEARSSSRCTTPSPGGSSLIGPTTTALS